MYVCTYICIYVYQGFIITYSVFFSFPHYLLLHLTRHCIIFLENNNNTYFGERYI